MGIGFKKSLSSKIKNRENLDTLSGRKAEIYSDEFFLGGGFGDGKSGTPERVTHEELSFETMEQMYEINVWVRACVDKIVRRAVSVQPKMKSVLRRSNSKPSDAQKGRIETIESFLAIPNKSNQSFDHIRRQLFTDILIWDAAALEMVNKFDGSSIEEIYAVSGDTIRINADKHGTFKSLKEAYIQKDYNNTKVATFAVDEMLYFMQYPRAKSVYGLSPLESLRQTVTGELYSADFNIQRFINDATPKFAIMFENLGTGMGSDAMQRLKTWWNQELRGKPHKPILIGSENGQIKFEKVGLSNEDMQFQEYSRWLLSKIMAVYHMQAAVLGVIEVNQGRINAQYQEEQFKKDALLPLLSTFSNQFNTNAIWSQKNFGFRDIYLSWEGLDDIDKERQAKIHELYLKHGVFTINMVLNELGYDPVPWGDVPYMFNQLEPIVGGISNDDEGDGTEEDDEFNKWLSNGISDHGVVPTGLEKIEKSEKKEAIAKLMNMRDKFRKKYSISSKV